MAHVTPQSRAPAWLFLIGSGGVLGTAVLTVALGTTARTRLELLGISVAGIVWVAVIGVTCTITVFHFLSRGIPKQVGPMLLLLAWACVRGAAQGVAWGTAASDVMLTGGMLSVYVLGYQARTVPDLSMPLRGGVAVSVGVIAIGALAILRMSWQVISMPIVEVRPTSRGREIALFLVINVIFLVAAASGTYRRLRRGVLLGVAALGYVAIALSISRGALVSVASGAGAVLFAGTRGKAHYRKWLPAIVLTIATGMIVFGTKLYRERSFGGRLYGGLAWVSHIDTHDRLRMARAMWNKVSQKPLTGWGLGASRLIAARAKPGVQEAYYPHNEYLQYWADLGAIGLGLLLWFIGATLVRSIRGIARCASAGDAAGRVWCIAASGITVAVLALCLVSNVLHYYYVALPWVWMLGVANGASVRG